MKQVLVTGASSGIGYNLVKSLCERGHKVWAAVRKTEVLQPLQKQYPQLLRVVKLDVTQQADIDQILSQISGDIDLSQEFILVNNAGIAVGSPVESLPLPEWRNLFEINFFGPVNLIQKFLPLIRKTHGRIINVGSISGRISSPFLAPYSSSKFALRAFTDSLRREISPLGVKVILIEPGPTQTNIWSKSMAHGQDLEAKLSEEMRTVYGKQIKMLRAGVDKTVQQAVPVERVIAKITEAIESENPDTHYLVGKNIFLLAAIAKFLPTRWLDKLLMSGFRGSKG